MSLKCAPNINWSGIAVDDVTIIQHINLPDWPVPMFPQENLRFPTTGGIHEAFDKLYSDFNEGTFYFLSTSQSNYADKLIDAILHDWRLHKDGDESMLRRYAVLTRCLTKEKLKDAEMSFIHFFKNNLSKRFDIYSQWIKLALHRYDTTRIPMLYCATVNLAMSRFEVFLISKLPFTTAYPHVASLLCRLFIDSSKSTHPEWWEDEKGTQRRKGHELVQLKNHAEWLLRDCQYALLNTYYPKEYCNNALFGDRSTSRGTHVASDLLMKYEVDREVVLPELNGRTSGYAYEYNEIAETLKRTRNYMAFEKDIDSLLHRNRYFEDVHIIYDRAFRPLAQYDREKALDYYARASFLFRKERSLSRVNQPILFPTKESMDEFKEVLYQAIEDDRLDLLLEYTSGFYDIVHHAPKKAGTDAANLMARTGQQPAQPEPTGTADSADGDIPYKNLTEDVISRIERNILNHPTKRLADTMMDAIPLLVGTDRHTAIKYYLSACLIRESILPLSSSDYSFMFPEVKMEDALLDAYEALRDVHGTIPWISHVSGQIADEICGSYRARSSKRKPVHAKQQEETRRKPKITINDEVLLRKEAMFQNTVERLSALLDDDDEAGTKMVDMSRTQQRKSMVGELLSLFRENDLVLTEDAVKLFASNHGARVNNLINSINEKYYDRIDDNLIEVEAGSYSIDEGYLKQIENDEN